MPYALMPLLLMSKNARSPQLSMHVGIAMTHVHHPVFLPNVLVSGCGRSCSKKEKERRVISLLGQHNHRWLTGVKLMAFSFGFLTDTSHL